MLRRAPSWAPHADPRSGPRKNPHRPARPWPPQGSLLLLLLATRYWLTVLITVGRAESIRTPSDHLLKRRSSGIRTIRSLRLRHTTRCHREAFPLPAPPSAAPACQRAAPVPEPAEPTSPADTVSRLRGRVDCAPRPLGANAWKNSLRSPGRRSRPHRSASGTPSVYYDATTMSSSSSWVALRVPARLTAMGPCEQESYCTRTVELCQVSLGAVACCDAITRGSRSSSEKSLSASAPILSNTRSGGVSRGNGA